MATFRCSQCAFEKQVSEDLVGKKARCPKCKDVSLITDDPVMPDVIEIEDDDPYDLWSDFKSDEKDNKATISTELPLQTEQQIIQGGPGVPKPRSFFTIALLAGGFFGIGMGLFITFQSGVGTGILAAVVGGPLFGFILAFFLSGKQIAVRFESRDDFINDMKRAFKKIKHEVVELSDPLFTFKHEQGVILVTTRVHVGRREAIFVGPRTYVKKFVRQLSDRHEVDWTGKKVKENHGEAPPDIAAQCAWIAAGVVLLVLFWGFKEISSPEGKAQSYVLSRLKAPSEVTFISAKIVGRNADGTQVEIVFEAPNSFGVKLRDSMTVVVKSDGSVGEF
ncbi:MAG: hypothetical protein SH868_11895 [Bythopirellula sp.]|nr:hypothetical protein [Bythopirellula sp.]